MSETEPTEGVIDRITDGVAVILAGDDETEITVAADELPEDAREGSRVAVSVGPPVTVSVIEAEPSTEELEGRLSRLKAQRPSGLLRRTDQ